MNASELIQAFSLDKNVDYFDITEIQNGNIGFCAKKHYPEESAFKPTRKHDGTPYMVVFLAVRLYQDASHDLPELIPLEIYASLCDNYASSCFYSTGTQPDSPTEASIRLNWNSPQPTKVSLYNKYFYNSKHKLICDAQGENIDGVCVLDNAYTKHLETVDTFRGNILRWKNMSISKITSLWLRIPKLIEYVLRHVFGRKMVPVDMLNSLFNGYKYSDLKRMDDESLDVFGVKASKNITALYFSLLLLAFAFTSYYKLETRWLKYIMENQLLSLAMTFFVLLLLDHLIPRILLMIINYFNRKRCQINSGR